MVLDTSALVSVVRNEPDADEIDAKLQAAPRLRMSAASYVEACMVLAGANNDQMLAALVAFLRGYGIVIEPLTVEDAKIGRLAFLRYGRGRGAASLNMGDCFSYALAKRVGEPLLFKGNDFSQTDIERG